MRITSNNHIYLRILIAIIMFCCVMWGYWWMTWCLAIGFLFYFPNHVEIIFLGIFYDSLYGTSLPEFWNVRYFFTISSIVIFIIAFLLRKSLIVYDDKI